jgi:hypothetical protein
MLNFKIADEFKPLQLANPVHFVQYLGRINLIPLKSDLNKLDAISPNNTSGVV